MLTIEEKAACLGRGVFARLDEAQRRAVAERMGERELDDGAVLFLEGEPGNELFLVAAGRVEIVRGGKAIAVLGPGELFGEMAVLGKGVRTAGGRARGATRLLFLRDRALAILIQQIPDIAFAVFGVLVERLEAANDLAFHFATPPAEKGELRFHGGDLAGRGVPVFHESAILGRSRGSLFEDAMRIALPSKDPALRDQHARLKISGGRATVEPLEGEVRVGGAVVEAELEIGPADEIAVGDLRFRFAAADEGR